MKYIPPVLSADQKQEMKFKAQECGLLNRGYIRCGACSIWIGPNDKVEWCATRPASQGMCPFTSVYRPPSKIKRIEEENEQS